MTPCLKKVNFYGLVFSLHYCLYIGSDMITDRVVCGLSECLWATLKPLLAWSIVGLSVFRLCAVVAPHFFRAWVQSPFRLAAPILANLVASFSFGTILKLILSTSNGPYLCLDGFSPLIQRVLIHLLVSAVLGTVLGPGSY